MNAEPNFKPAKAAPNPEYLALVRALPCCICQAFGELQNSPTEAHHTICGRFGTRKTPDTMAIPLCHGHHLGDFDTTKLAIHRNRAAWVERYGEDVEYIAFTQDQIEPFLNMPEGWRN